MHRTLILPAVIALSACQLAPEHVQPALPTAPEYDVAYQPSGDVRATDIAWRAYFRDPRLQVLIAAALDNNRDLRVATARIEEARGQYRIQRSQQLPNVDASASGTRSRTPADLAGGTAITGNNFDVSVGVSAFELDFWGRVRNLSAAAKAQYLSTVEAQRAFRLSLISDVASLYFATLDTQERIALSQATLQSREDGLRIADKRLQAGVTSALDYRQAEALLTQAQSDIASQQLALAQAQNALLVLVGGPIAGDLPNGLPLIEQRLSKAINPGMPSELLLNRPDIIAAEQQLIAARANIGAARAAFFPTISLTGTGGFASGDLGGLFDSDGLSWRFGPSISLPIFDWGAREGDLSVAKARETIEIATYEKTIQTAFQEVSDALAGRRYLADQVTARERAVTAQERIAYIARLRYREGVAQYLEVLDAERSLFSAQQALIQARRAELDNLVSLYVALGGGAQ